MKHIKDDARRRSAGTDCTLTQRTQESDIKDYNWSPLIEFLTSDEPPYAVAEALLTCHFQLTDYIMLDQERDNIDQEAVRDGLYVMRRLYQVLQEIEEAGTPRQGKITQLEETISSQKETIAKQNSIIKELKDKVGFMVAGSHMVCHLRKKLTKAADKPSEKSIN